jgi:DNA-binding Lrp family transcriptional regulator
MLSQSDRRIIHGLQAGFPIAERPFSEVAAGFGMSEDELIACLTRLREDGVLSRFGPVYDAAVLGGAVTLCGMAVPKDRFDAVAAVVNTFSEVAHNSRREHAFNMWFVLATGRPEDIAAVICQIKAKTGLDVLNLPKLEEYQLEPNRGA